MSLGVQTGPFIPEKGKRTWAKKKKKYKRWKNRIERRRANMNPECAPGYGKYSSDYWLIYW